MAQLKISMDLAPAVYAHRQAMQQAMLRVRDAVQMVAINTAAEWQTAIYKARLWSGEREAYAKSVTWRMTGDLSAEVYSDYRYAQQIEEGRPAYDLKRMLDTSLKVRMSKKGKRYLIIPFRHNTPGYTAHSTDMPEHVYQAAKQLTFSRITGMGTRASGTGVFDPKTKAPLQVPQAKYFWGTRLPAGSMGPNPRGKVDRFAGMVRFADTATKGKKPKSIFMTFRVMVEGSPGWAIQPRPGLGLADAVTTKMRPQAMREFIAALKGIV